MLLNSGVGASQKVLEAYMGEAWWLAEPTRGQKAQHLHARAHGRRPASATAWQTARWPPAVGRRGRPSG